MEVSTIETTMVADLLSITTEEDLVVTEVDLTEEVTEADLITEEATEKDLTITVSEIVIIMANNKVVISEEEDPLETITAEEEIAIKKIFQEAEPEKSPKTLLKITEDLATIKKAAIIMKMTKASEVPQDP